MERGKEETERQVAIGVAGLMVDFLEYRTQLLKEY